MTDSPYRVDFEALCKELEQRGIDVGINPVRAAITAIDYLRQQRDGAEALARAAAEDYNRARDELEDVSGGLAADQEIRDRALRHAAMSHAAEERDPARLIADANVFAAYIRDGSVPPRVSAEERSDDTSDLGGSE